MSLVEFLTARLAEDDRMAKAVAGSGRWSPYVEGGDDGWAIEDGEVGDPAAIIGDEAMAKHMGRHDPARVLAEVAAKRGVLHAHYDYNGLCPRCFDFGNKPVPREPWPCETVRLLALPYADHPDYLEEWQVLR